MVRWFDKVLGIQHLAPTLSWNVAWIRFVRFYLLDMLWAYALVFAVYVVINDKAIKLWKVLLGAGILSVLMETIQLSPFIHGTFDFYDILAEFVAELIAAFAINKLITGEETNEKK